MLIPIVFALGLAQSQDLTLSLGTLNSSDTKAGQYLGANYAHRIVHSDLLALSGQIDFSASPNRKYSLVNPLGSRDVASLYVIPGLRLSLRPEARVSPFVAGGVGYAAYEQSELQQNGARFTAARNTNHLGGVIGGGMDIKIYRFAGLRFEFKDYISQGHNYAAGVGLHFRWGGN